MSARQIPEVQTFNIPNTVRIDLTDSLHLLINQIDAMQTAFDSSQAYAFDGSDIPVIIKMIAIPMHIFANELQHKGIVETCDGFSKLIPANTKNNSLNHSINDALGLVSRLRIDDKDVRFTDLLTPIQIMTQANISTSKVSEPPIVKLHKLKELSTAY